MTELEKVKLLLNQHGYLVIRLGKGQIKLARECGKDCYNCDEGCMNRRCLNNLINEQITIDS